MNDRLLRWVGAGVLAAGLSTAMLVCAGIAVASPDSTADAATSSSQSDDDAKSTSAQVDSTDAAAEVVGTEADAEGDDGSVVEEEPTAEEETPVEEEPADTTDTTDESAVDKRDSDPAAVDAEEPAVNDVETTEPESVTRDDAPVVDEKPRPAVEPAAPTSEPLATEQELPTTPAPEQSTARFMLSAVEAEEAAPAGPTLINIIGTLAWSLFDLVVRTIAGPPAVPPGSTVTAGRSTLEIDCGDGYTTDADWYFPKEGQPEKLIYVQHGFLARASFYNLTLAELAERNNAIVVAPSITSNYFACDGCSITADPMHAAVARLFDGDRAALLDSARAAGFEGTLPTKFVLSGQSAGAILAAGASGYFYDSAAADRKADMVGVLLFEGSAANGALARALDKMPSTVPVLHVAGTPAVINNGGDANQVLAQKRPGQFNGVQLIGGAHTDAFRSSGYFGLVQAIVSLGFGASAPENVEAVQVLAQGWLTDMYAGRVYDPATRTGIYGDPGLPGATVIDIPTDAGLAQGYVLPGPPPALSPIERFFASILHSINSNNFATCAAEPSAPEADLRQNSTPNTALSLDGRTQRGQSVGQQCMDG